MSYEESWKRTSVLLAKARAKLPASPVVGKEGGSAKSYEEFLAHNELELALDELEMLAEVNPVDQEFWQIMHSAACEMKLGRHSQRYQAHF